MDVDYCRVEGVLREFRNRFGMYAETIFAVFALQFGLVLYDDGRPIWAEWVSGTSGCVVVADHQEVRAMPAEIFICHATEDKDQFVRPLADALKKLGLEIWYDEFSLQPGDSLRGSIESALGRCRYAIVVFSQAFFRKPYANWELNGLVERHISESGSILIPIWHGVSVEEVRTYSPPLADVVALRSDLGERSCRSNLLCRTA